MACFLELEDGTGHFLLEDGSGSLLLEVCPGVLVVEDFWLNPKLVQRPVAVSYLYPQQALFSEEIPAGSLLPLKVRVTQAVMEEILDPRYSGFSGFARLTQAVMELQIDPRLSGFITFARTTQAAMEVAFDPRYPHFVTNVLCTQGVIEVILKFGNANVTYVI